MSQSPSMGSVVRSGRFETRASFAHSVHVMVDGLRPGGDYWYRFRCGKWLSPIGHTRTAPGPGQHVTRLCWVAASCQSWADGHYTAHRHLAAEDVDVVLFLGDYIYEKPIEVAVRGRAVDVSDEIVGEADTLERYRLRYALYKLDPDLQRAHHATPWIVTWDDHEVQDGYAGSLAGSGGPVGLAGRRRAAYQAFWEHQPLRVGPPSGAGLRIHRRVTYGDLATFHVLDTRQHRSPSAAGEIWQKDSLTRRDPTRTMLGAAQEAWLKNGLTSSTARWNIVAQQVIAGRLDLEPADGELFNVDAWDGYQPAQQRVFGELSKCSNPIVITGDVHAGYALEIERQLSRRATPVAVELTTSSITSGGDGAPLLDSGRAFLAANPHLRYASQQRGYLRCRLVPGHLAADFRTVPFVERPGAPVTTDGSFLIEAGPSRLRPLTVPPTSPSVPTGRAARPHVSVVEG